MRYAIVDIETTGGNARQGAITEIAILLHDGKTALGEFYSLVNPEMPIPRYITALTGISDQDVADAPVFSDIADQVFAILQDAVFVAHNVNFDYSFLLHQLQAAGYSLQSRKLCTVRYARKVVPGLSSYSLGNLCRDLDIPIENRHRAMGDARATRQLLELLWQRDEDNHHLTTLLKGRQPGSYLPPNLREEDVTQLPELPGVYYFLDQKDQLLYVGKARNLRKRVKSHFSNNDGGRRKQELLRKVYRVQHRVTSSELMALILESVEIRRKWPPFNRSQKKFHPQFALYVYEDQRGYHRMVIERKRQQIPFWYSCNTLLEGMSIVRMLIRNFSLDEAIHLVPQVDYQACTDDVEANNRKTAEALNQLQSLLPSFAIQDSLLEEEGTTAVLLMEQGSFQGWGKLTPDEMSQGLSYVKARIDPMPDNDYIRSLIYQYARQFPDRKINFD
jgi:DNA polymerase-3 subunit epsilon